MTALKWKEGDKVVKLTYEEYWDKVVAVGRSFIKVRMVLMELRT